MKKVTVWILGGIGLVGLFFGVSLTLSSLSPKKELTWDEYKAYKAAIARENKQPVVIDFYADWCIACHELESLVFSDPAVIDALENFVRLRVDATDMEAAAVQQVMDQYNVFGLPIVVFLDKEGREFDDARVIGLVPPEEFLKSTQMVLSE
ncbi:MAG: thioredoxin family protein [Candidatus Omnitrophota bacterium]